MSVEPGEVLGFPAEYEPEPEEKPPPRHARPRAHLRRMIALLSAALLLSVGLSAYLWLRLDDERSGQASMVATNNAFETSLERTQQRLTETQQALSDANDKVASSETGLAKLQRQLEAAQKRAADLKKDVRTATSDLDESRAAADDFEATIQGSIDLLNSCTNATAQVAASLEAGRYDREALAQQARQAAGLCSAAADALASR
jgi:chromosome segregation ATPase